MDIIKKLSKLFSDFPTVGSRTANRFVLYLAKLPKEKIDELINAILELKNNIKFCTFCLQPFDSLLLNQTDTKNNLCVICQNQLRNKNMLCIVEKENDLSSIENSKKYNGLYLVLNLQQSLSQEINTLKLEGIKKRIKNPENFGIKNANFTEIIIATNPTPEGINSSVLVERILKEIAAEDQNKPNFKITHLARGIPVGGELEYADPETLESAFDGRK